MGVSDYTSSRSWVQQRKFLLCSIAAVFILAIFFLGSHQRNVRHVQAADAQEAFAAQNRSTKLHVLLPASNPEVNLCKTILTSKILGYETPTLIAWNQHFDTPGLLGGGSHVAKISKVLEHLNSMDASMDDDLVLMMDAYGAFNLYDKLANKHAHLEADIWFQLPPEVLISRYHAINAAANRRLTSRLGRTAREKEGITQTIVFGAGKRCAPNEVHTIACYPIPESPLPDDLYGPNTDTIMGRNKYTSLRQRWLNSGYALGPVKDMRKLFKRAEEKVEDSEQHDFWDNGSHGTDLMYHGSDQSVFNIILGEQEYQREVVRRKYLSPIDKARGREKVAPTWIEGTKVDDPLKPKFFHEPMRAEAGKSYEFGMGLDYFSDMGQQTVNAEEDARWIRYDGDLQEQVGEQTLFECSSKLTQELPEDMSRLRDPFAGVPAEAFEGGRPSSWREIPLYSNICLNTIPVMVHHNGDKEARERSWPELWLQPHARKLLAATGSPAGAMEGLLGSQRSFSWDELCPADMERELFRDVE